MIRITRREGLAYGLAGLAVAGLGAPGAFAATVDELTAAFTGGTAPTGAEGLTLTTPEIAENGNTVPVTVEAEGATEITLIATGNPEPAVATFMFGPAAGSRRASTRIRLAKTQDVVAIAKMEDGSFRQVSNNVKVTIGGCGG